MEREKDLVVMSSGEMEVVSVWCFHCECFPDMAICDNVLRCSKCRKVLGKVTDARELMSVRCTHCCFDDMATSDGKYLCCSFCGKVFGEVISKRKSNVDEVEN